MMLVAFSSTGMGGFVCFLGVSLTTSPHSASVYRGLALVFCSDVSNVTEVDRVSRGKRQGAVGDAV